MYFYLTGDIDYVIAVWLVSIAFYHTDNIDYATPLWL